MTSGDHRVCPKPGQKQKAAQEHIQSGFESLSWQTWKLSPRSVLPLFVLHREESRLGRTKPAHEAGM